MIANARMYSVSPPAAAAWRQLLGWVVECAGLAQRIGVVDYPAPAPLPTLWDRSDIACVFMCGLPFAQRQPQALALAAPVPSAPAYANLARYRSHLIVRADAPFQRLEDTFGHRLAYTDLHSQSGHHAVQQLLKPYQTAQRPSPYARTIGPLVTPRRALQAVIDGEVEVGPLDSYAHDLLRLHEPELMAQVRVIASTAFTPNPLLVAALGTDAGVVHALQAALLAVEDSPELEGLRRDLALRRFARVDPGDYAALADACSGAAA